MKSYFTNLAILCDLFVMVKWPDEKVTLNHLELKFPWNKGSQFPYGY